MHFIEHWFLLGAIVIFAGMVFSFVLYLIMFGAGAIFLGIYQLFIKLGIIHEE
jgi:hypothetical protein